MRALWIIAAAGLAAVAHGASAGEMRSLDAATLPTAAAFVDSFGANVHLTWLDTSYADVGRVKASMEHLGLRHMRDQAPPDWWPGPYATLAAAGFAFDLYVPVHDGQAALAESVENAADLERAHPGSVPTIEGPNEVNYWPAPWKGRSDLPGAAVLQRDLFAAVRAEPALTATKVVALTLGGAGPADYAPLGDLSDAADLGNAHIYFPAGTQPTRTWGWASATGLVPTPGLPLVVTETGYYDLPDGDRGVDSRTQAAQTLNLMLNAAESGVRRTFLYQLMDNWTDRPEAENSYGLFKADGTPKPAADAVGRLVRAVTAKEGTLSPSPLAYALDGAPGDLRTRTMRGEGGKVVLVAWREPETWDAGSRTSTPATPAAMTLRVSRPVDATVTDPLASSPPERRAGTDAVPLRVSDHPVAVVLSDPDVVPASGSGRPRFYFRS